MSSREQFEAWLSSEYQWANDALNEAHFHGDDATGYYTGGDFIYDGRSCSDALFWAWRGWQESHQQGEDKCAALAAENAGLKEWSPNPHSASMFEAIEKAEALMDDGMPELAMVEAFEILKMKRTPATDSFLAEVRAQGIEMLTADRKSEWMDSYIEDASEFAAQLRKGAAE